MNVKELDNRKFVELLRMMAGQDEGGFGEVFREAARRLEELELCANNDPLIGEWVIEEVPNHFDTFGNPDKRARCTNCGFTWNDLYSVKNYFKSCPNCSAEMKLHGDTDQ